MPTLSIRKYLAYSGSTFRGGADPSFCVAATERWAKRAFNAEFLSGVSSFSFIVDARLENRSLSAACLSGRAGASILCSSSERLGSRSSTVTSFPSRSRACMTEALGNPSFCIRKYLEYSGSSHRIFGFASSSSDRAARLANKAFNALLAAASFVESMSVLPCCRSGFSIVSNTRARRDDRFSRSDCLLPASSGAACSTVCANCCSASVVSGWPILVAKSAESLAMSAWLFRINCSC